MDSSEAKIFRVAPSPSERTRLKRTEIRHHTHADPENHKDGSKFFREIAADLEHADEVLLIGPGLAKDRFRSFLQEHSPSGLARKIVGVETVDHPSEAEILARSRRFFKVYDLFHAE